MKAILHIGQSKTGTSAIQTFLAENRSALLKQGVLYPDITVGGVYLEMVQHNSIADSLTGRKVYPYLSADAYFKQIRNAVHARGVECLVLSAEHFFGGEPRVWNVTDETVYFDAYRKKLAELKLRLNFCDTFQIILYLRNQQDWLSSSVAHTIRFQLLHDHKNVYQNDRQYFEMVRPLLRYGKLLDCWSETFGPEAIQVACYNRENLHNADATQDFIKRAGIHPNGMDFSIPASETNLSLSAEFVEVKKILNQDIKHKDVERATIACLDSLSTRRSKNRRYSLDPAVLVDLAEIAKRENAHVNARYLSRGQELNLPRTPQEPKIPEEDIQHALAEFHSAFAKPKYRRLIWKLRTKSFLRNKVTPLHTVLRRIKHVVRKGRARA